MFGLGDAKFPHFPRNTKLLLISQLSQLATYLQDCLCFLHFVASVLQHALALAKAAAIVFALIPMLKCNYEHASNIKSSP